jgi:hypothetical protein
LRQRVFHRSQTVGDEALGEALRNDALDIFPEKLVALVTELSFRLQVEQNDRAGLVDDDHGIGSGFQKSVGPLRQVRFGIPAHEVVSRSH